MVLATIPDQPRVERIDRVRLPGGRWSLWSTACLRAAGFPAAGVLALSSPATARLANRFVKLRANRGSRARSGEAVSALAVLKEAFEAEAVRARAALRAIAADATFQEAVLWQNRGAFQHAVVPLAVGPATESGSARRKAELLVANYLQRYCVKNDTIGFFGPVGWVRLSEGPEPIAFDPGGAVLAERNFHLETWGVDACARTFDADPQLRPWRIPRIPATVALDGNCVVVGTRAVRQLSDAERDLLAACDGDRHAGEIARQLRAVYGVRFSSDDAVYELLDKWCSAGILTWSFEGPRELHPERALRRRLETIEDPELRARACGRLQEIEAAAHAVRDATGRVGALAEAMASLESTFARVTGAAATRAPGQMYASRTLVYEDCRREGDVDLGADVLNRLGPPLSLLLASAHWAMRELARRQREQFRQLFDRLKDGGGRPVPLATFLPRTSLVSRVSTSLSAIGAAVRDDLQARWAALLAPPPDARRVAYRTLDLKAKVHAAFPADKAPSLSWMRHVSPDVMIDAPSLDAIRRGQYQLVLGEMHVFNTLQQRVFVAQHPSPDEIVQALDDDLPAPRVVWIVPKEASSERVQFVVRPIDFGLATGRDPSPLPAERTLRIADLEVVDDGGVLFVQTRDHAHRFDCVEFFGCVLIRRNGNLFGLLPPRSHTPRLTIDDVVVAREQWQVRVADLTFATRGDDRERYVECQRWAHQLGLPSQVFVKLPSERKPTYVDLTSPTFVDLFARFVRTLLRSEPSAVIAITEMLPGFDGLWLRDAEGRAYTSELRLVAVAPS